MPPQGESHTLYVRNINDKIKFDTLKKALYLLFSAYGDVIEVHMRKNSKYRGQAWVVFKFSKDCTRALQKVQDVLFYGKQLKLSIATSKSDIIAKVDGTYSATEKLARIQRELESTMVGGHESSDNDPHNTSLTKRKLPDSTDINNDNNDTDGHPTKRSNTGTSTERPRYLVSEEPTATLFACNFPMTTTTDQIQTFFDNTPTTILPLMQNEADQLYDQLPGSSPQLPIWLVTFASISGAQDAIENKARFKLDDDLRLRLVFCYDSKPLTADTTVQLGQ